MRNTRLGVVRESHEVALLEKLVAAVLLRRRNLPEVAANAIAADLSFKLLEIAGLTLAARVVFHAVVKNWTAGMMNALFVLLRRIAGVNSLTAHAVALHSLV